MVVFRRILVAIDGSPWSQQATGRAIAIAADQNADIHFVHVIERARMEQAFNQEAFEIHLAGEKLLDEAVDRACEHDLLGTSAVLVTDDRHGTVAQQILWAAGAEAADLIVCGRRGAGQCMDRQLGSVAGELASEGKFPLLLAQALAASQA